MVGVMPRRVLGPGLIGLSMIMSVGCGSTDTPDAAASFDASGAFDGARSLEAGRLEAGTLEAGTPEAGTPEADASGGDASLDGGDATSLDAPASSTTTFWVCPTGDDSLDGLSRSTALRTLDGARTRWRAALRRTPNVVVQLCGGIHARTTTLELGPLDSPDEGGTLVLRSIPGERATLSAARAIDDALWVAEGSSFSLVAEADDHLQVFAEEESALADTLRLARTPSDPASVPATPDALPTMRGWFDDDAPYQTVVASTGTYAGAPFASFRPASDGGMRWHEELVATARWVRHRVPVLAVAVAGADTFVSPVTGWGRVESDVSRLAPTASTVLAAAPYLPAASTRAFFVEGDEPDAPGEYSFERATRRLVVHTTTRPSGLRIATGLRTLVRVAGTRGLRIEDLTFAHTTTQPVVGAFATGHHGLSGVSSLEPSGDGYANTLFGADADGTAHGAIVLGVGDRGSDLSFARTRFADLGTSAVVLTGTGVRASLDGVTMLDVDGNGVAAWLGPTDVSISGSRFERVGHRYGLDAIALVGVDSFTVVSNDFVDLPARAVYAFASTVYDATLPLRACCAEGSTDCPMRTRRIVRNRIVRAARSVTDVGAINIGASDVQIEGNAVLHTYRTPLVPVANGEGLNKPFYLDVGTRNACVHGNAVAGASDFLLANCQMDSSVLANATGPLEDATALTTLDVRLAFAACSTVAGAGALITPYLPADAASCSATYSCVRAAADMGSFGENGPSARASAIFAASGSGL